MALGYRGQRLAPLDEIALIAKGCGEGATFPTDDTLLPVVGGKAADAPAEEKFLEGHPKGASALRTSRTMTFKEHKSSPATNDQIIYIGTYTRTEPHVQGKAEGIYTYRLDGASGALHYMSVAAGAVNPSFRGGRCRAALPVRGSGAGCRTKGSRAARSARLRSIRTPAP